jgi:hypothetical protein
MRKSSSKLAGINVSHLHVRLTREPELQEWVTKMKPEDKKSYPLKPEIAEAIDRFFFNHYCKSFRSGAFARANSTM